MIYGRFSADRPYGDYMAFSVNWGPFLVRVLIIRSLLLGVYVRALDFWKLPHADSIWKLALNKTFVERGPYDCLNPDPYYGNFRTTFVLDPTQSPGSPVHNLNGNIGIQYLQVVAIFLL